MNALALVLLPPRETAACQIVLGDAWSMRVCKNVTGLRAALDVTTPGIIVCDARDRFGGDTTRALIERLSPTEVCTVLVRWRPGMDEASDLMDLIKAGIRVVPVMADHDDLSREVAAAAEGWVPHASRTAILQSYGDRETTPLNDLVVASLSMGPRTRSVQKFAALMGVSRRTLVRLAIRQALPSPKSLLSWSTCLHAVWHLDIGHWPAKKVAQSAGFHSLQAFNHFFRRCTGRSPVLLARESGFPGLMERWLSVLRRDSAPPLGDHGQA